MENSFWLHFICEKSIAKLGNVLPVLLLSAPHTSARCEKYASHALSSVSPTIPKKYNRDYKNPPSMHCLQCHRLFPNIIIKIIKIRRPCTVFSVTDYSKNIIIKIIKIRRPCTVFRVTDYSKKIIEIRKIQLFYNWKYSLEQALKWSLYLEHDILDGVFDVNGTLGQA